ncbi:helix-turn-helix domain-containing protein [Actinomadura sp. ATCC 31491]|uniref:Helix-turn-helix domain-containing protein n=1 Tax=Actinomadura luzonensis TaxID=2805427 RepID=A0ABT0G4P1_9ACTN|nr:helix-turn-helix transcriptional regulator [Actinomadura luzonensis]MCK2219563.1 helix-turn-helix domain-containing protein [Actinomadura luzonensis]
MNDQVEVGGRIARQRRRRGLSQQAAAGLIGRSESWLSQVERGVRRIDSHSVLVRLAQVLGVSVHELTHAGQQDGESRYRPGEGIREAMLRYDMLSPFTGQAESPHRLRIELHRINRLYQSARYEEAGQRLPGLILAVEHGRQAVPRKHRRPADTLRALTYQCAATVLTRVDEPELAWLAADRSLAAAEDADRPLLAAVSAYRLGYILIKMHRPEQARDLAVRAAESLHGDEHRTNPVLASVRGGLYLVAASAAAHTYDRGGTDSHLAEATAAADHIGRERNDFWTAFGITNIRIHRLSSAVAFGDAKLAVALGEALDLSRLPVSLLGRRAQVHLDLARAYTLQRKDAAAVNTLLNAEQLSPQLIRYDQRTRDVLAQLVKREHRPSTPQLRGLACRAGIV